MAKYSITVAGFQSAAAAGTFESVLGLEAGAAEKGKLKSISIGGGGEAPKDVQMTARLVRSDQTTAGTATARTPTKKDPAGRASDMTGKHTYTAEPTTLDTEFLLEFGFNGRGTVVKEFQPGQEPEWGPSETLLLQVAPGEATAVKVDATLEWEE